jgi:hypothetical protein
MVQRYARIIAATLVAPAKTKIEIDGFVSRMMRMNHLQPREKCTSSSGWKSFQKTQCKEMLFHPQWLIKSSSTGRNLPKAWCGDNALPLVTFHLGAKKKTCIHDSWLH